MWDSFGDFSPSRTFANFDVLWEEGSCRERMSDRPDRRFSSAPLEDERRHLGSDLIFTSTLQMLKVRVHCVNGKQQKNRAECCQRLLPKLGDEFVKRIIFSGEKLFLISPSRDSNKGRIWTTLRKKELSPSVLQSPRSTSQRGLMVWAGVSWNGKTELLFVEPGLKINAEYYVQQLREDILPSCSRLYHDGSFVLQQDWAPSHASRKTRLFGFSGRRISQENRISECGVEYLKKTEYPTIYQENRIESGYHNCYYAAHISAPTNF
ncbi:unnamed protein product [Haemonchus placei]|uniref:DDE_3 domain-containing protein n=1 Tax=Haemonchus placei TaxID=6290 RepID=A0A0N4X5H3_HAEPC|nr:unnamed protein product [Haemonchus placei]